MKFTYIFPVTFSLFLSSFSAHAMDIDEVVEYVYDRSVTYSPGAFSHYKEGTTTLSTHPQAPQAPYTQRVLIYDKDPQEFIREKVLKKIILGQDGRTRVPKTTDWPHSMCTQLSMIFKGKVYGGSGAFVGPQQIFTCGHNVWIETRMKRITNQLFAKEFLFAYSLRTKKRGKVYISVHLPSLRRAAYARVPQSFA